MRTLKHRSSVVDSLTKTRIKIQIPKTCQNEPVISRLTSDYGLTFNITKAMLEANNREEGVLELELIGTPEQIQRATAYLLKLQVKIWGKPNPDGDAW